MPVSPLINRLRMWLSIYVQRQNRQRGMALGEMLVATAILTTTILVVAKAAQRNNQQQTYLAAKNAFSQFESLYRNQTRVSLKKFLYTDLQNCDAIGMPADSGIPTFLQGPSSLAGVTIQPTEMAANINTLETRRSVYDGFRSKCMTSIDRRNYGDPNGALIPYTSTDLKTCLEMRLSDRTRVNFLSPDHPVYGLSDVNFYRTADGASVTCNEFVTLRNADPLQVYALVEYDLLFITNTQTDVVMFSNSDILTASVSLSAPGPTGLLGAIQANGNSTAISINSNEAFNLAWQCNGGGPATEADISPGLSGQASNGVQQINNLTASQSYVLICKDGAETSPPVQVTVNVNSALPTAVCGPADNLIFDLTHTSGDVSAAGACGAGSSLLGSIDDSNPALFTWQCRHDTNTTSTVSCDATRQSLSSACGPANGMTFPLSSDSNDVAAAGACASGSALFGPGIQQSATEFTWQCRNSANASAAPVSCAATRAGNTAVCGPAHGSTFVKQSADPVSFGEVTAAGACDSSTSELDPSASISMGPAMAAWTCRNKADTSQQVGCSLVIEPYTEGGGLTVDITAKINAPNEDYSDGPLYIQSSDGVRLRWSSTNATSCRFRQESIDSNGTPTGGVVEFQDSLNATMPYNHPGRHVRITITCTDSIDTVADYVNIFLAPAVWIHANGHNDSVIISEGMRVLLDWRGSSGASSCTVTPDPEDQGSGLNERDVRSQRLYVDTTFTVTCTGAGPSVSDSVDVRVVPVAPHPGGDGFTNFMESVGASRYGDDVFHLKHLAVDGEGRIIVGGTQNFGMSSLHRLDPFGMFEEAYHGYPRPYDEQSDALALQPDDQKLINIRNFWGVYDDNSDSTPDRYTGRFQITRINKDFTTDTGFGTNGLVDYDNGELGAGDVAVQSDGKLVVAGWYRATETSREDAFAARFNPDGSVDTTFGTNGLAVVTMQRKYSGAVDLKIHSDGKILLASTVGIIRLNSNGSLDNTFGNSGIVRTNPAQFTNEGLWIHAVEIQPDGKILAAGIESYNPAIRLANPNRDHLDMGIRRFRSDGTPDPSFGGGDGIVAISNGTYFDYLHDIKIQPNGDIVVAGKVELTEARSSGGFRQKQPASGMFLFARIKPNGSLDSSFGSGGVALIPPPSGNPGSVSINAIEILSDGKILGAGDVAGPGGGFNKNTIIKLLPDGSLDTSFGGTWN